MDKATIINKLLSLEFCDGPWMMKHRIALQCYRKIELEVIHLAADNPSLSDAQSTSSLILSSFSVL